MKTFILAITAATALTLAGFSSKAEAHGFRHGGYRSYRCYSSCCYRPCYTYSCSTYSCSDDSCYDGTCYSSNWWWRDRYHWNRTSYRFNGHGRRR